MTTAELEQLIREAPNRQAAAEAYARALIQEGTNRESPDIDWPAANKAILARWSRSGLQWIKARAWKVAKDSPTAQEPDHA